MKILIIGDIFGKIGRRVIKSHLREVKEKHQIDLVIANVENTTHGKGISFKHYQELKDYGIDIMTSGNHIFALEETRKYIDKTSDLLRPLNSSPYHPGKGSIIIPWGDKKIRITNLIGTTFMPPAQNPYFALEKLLENDDSDIHLVDFHAETTAEKAVLAYCFDGRITALWGTHTHVQTADEKILSSGTAFLTDVGMTGPAEGIIGAQPEGIVQRSKYNFPARMQPYKEGKGQFNGLVLEIDNSSNRVISLQRILKIFLCLN